MKKEVLESRGLMCFCAGHPHYGKMAAAFAATVKAIEDVPICLLWHGDILKHLSEAELKLFDIKIQLEDKYVYNKDGSFNPIKARLHFYDLTPFDETLCIDVDNVWLHLKTPTDAFTELANTPFTLQNAGYTLCDENVDQYYSVWADLPEVIKGYGIEGRRFYRTYGEWIYFKKSAEAKKLFAAAKKIFMSRPKATKILEFIGQAITDELAFSIAMAQTEIYPHQDKYHPTTYFHINSKGLYRWLAPYKLAKDYYTISMGGSSNPEYSIRNYNIVVDAAYYKLGLTGAFQWKEKRKFLEERKTA